MPAIVIVGAQWGDEGKGIETDREAEKADAVVRFNGSSNAGHTLWVDGKKYVTHQCPSGIIRPGKMNIVGPMVLCDLEALKAEFAMVEEFGSRLLIDRSAPVILPIHREIDKGRELAAGKGAIGTTGRGVGPGYEDFWARRGLKLGDLVSEDATVHALQLNGYYAEKHALARHYRSMNVLAPSFDETVAWCAQFIPLVQPLLADTRAIIADMILLNKNILFEGAQGVMLDTVNGTYPFATSSLCTPASIAASFGIYRFDRVIGVAKAYVTRVGGGPFPTEQENESGQELREKGGEFGATTGRPRRCGWLDLVALNYACRIAGITELFITKLDVLSGTAPRVCIGYEFAGQRLSASTTLTNKVMRESKPIYDLPNPSWQEDISGCRTFDDLPQAAREYVMFIMRFTQTRVSGVGVGPDRHQALAM